MRSIATKKRTGRLSMACRHGFTVALALSLATVAARAEVSELKISRQPGLLFAPALLMEHHKLVEKLAKPPASRISRSPGSGC
jgi:hypothetical protein